MKTQLALLIICTSILSSCSVFTRNACNDNSKKDYQKSVDHFSKKVNKNPKDEKALYNLGMSYYKLAEYKKAIKTFDKLIEVNPTIDTYSNRGLCKYFLKNQDGACEDFQKSIDAGYDSDIMGGKSLAHYIKENCNKEQPANTDTSPL